MAKKKEVKKEKKASRSDTVRAAVDQAFQATAQVTADAGNVTRGRATEIADKRATEIADELVGNITRLRDGAGGRPARLRRGRPGGCAPSSPRSGPGDAAWSRPRPPDGPERAEAARPGPKPGARPPPSPPRPRPRPPARTAAKPRRRDRRGQDGVRKRPSPAPGPARAARPRRSARRPRPGPPSRGPSAPGQDRGAASKGRVGRSPSPAAAKPKPTAPVKTGAEQQSRPPRRERGGDRVGRQPRRRAGRRLDRSRPLRCDRPGRRGRPIYGAEPAAPAFWREDDLPPGADREKLRTRFQRDVAEIEQLVAVFARRRPDVACTTLRMQPVVGG